MDLPGIVHELRALNEEYKKRCIEKEAATVLYCNGFCTILQRFLDKNPGPYEEYVFSLCIFLCHYAASFGELAPHLSKEKICQKLFRLCVKAVLDVKWQQLPADNTCNQKFRETVDAVHTQLERFDYCQFSLVKSLMDSHWSHPILTKVMAGSDDLDEEEGITYIAGEDPVVLKLRVEMMLQENCEEFALNLCNWCTKHPDLQDDVEIHETQLLMLHRLNNIEKLQEECENMPCHMGVKIIRNLQEIESQQSFCVMLVQTFLVQDWIRASDHCCTKELLKLWIRHQYLADGDIAKFSDSVWAIAKLSKSTEQIEQLVEALREEAGDTFIQLITDLYIYSVNIDKVVLERAYVDDDKDLILSQKCEISKTCQMLTNLYLGINVRISQITILTSFALVPTKEAFQLVCSLFSSDDDINCDKVLLPYGECEIAENAEHSMLKILLKREIQNKMMRKLTSMLDELRVSPVTASWKEMCEKNKQSCTCSQRRESSLKERTPINPATLYEIERLLSLICSEYINPELPWNELKLVCVNYLEQKHNNHNLNEEHKQSTENVQQFGSANSSDAVNGDAVEQQCCESIVNVQSPSKSILEKSDPAVPQVAIPTASQSDISEVENSDKQEAKGSDEPPQVDVVQSEIAPAVASKERELAPSVGNSTELKNSSESQNEMPKKDSLVSENNSTHEISGCDDKAVEDQHKKHCLSEQTARLEPESQHSDDDAKQPARSAVQEDGAKEITAVSEEPVQDVVPVSCSCDKSLSVHTCLSFDSQIDFTDMLDEASPPSPSALQPGDAGSTVGSSEQNNQANMAVVPDKITTHDQVCTCKDKQSDSDTCLFCRDRKLAEGGNKETSASPVSGVKKVCEVCAQNKLNDKDAMIGLPSGVAVRLVAACTEEKLTKAGPVDDLVKLEKSELAVEERETKEQKSSECKLNSLPAKLDTKRKGLSFAGKTKARSSTESTQKNLSRDNARRSMTFKAKNFAKRFKSEKSKFSHLLSDRRSGSQSKKNRPSGSLKKRYCIGKNRSKLLNYPKALKLAKHGLHSGSNSSKLSEEELIEGSASRTVAERTFMDRYAEFLRTFDRFSAKHRLLRKYCHPNKRKIKRPYVIVYRCGICCEFFDKVYELKDHVRSICKPSLSDIRYLKEPASFSSRELELEKIKFYKCLKCLQFTRTRREMDDHQRLCGVPRMKMAKFANANKRISTCEPPKNSTLTLEQEGLVEKPDSKEKNSSKVPLSSQGKESTNISPASAAVPCDEAEGKVTNLLDKPGKAKRASQKGEAAESIKPKISPERQKVVKLKNEHFKCELCGRLLLGTYRFQMHVSACRKKHFTGKGVLKSKLHFNSKKQHSKNNCKKKREKLVATGSQKLLKSQTNQISQNQHEKLSGCESVESAVLGPHSGVGEDSKCLSDRQISKDFGLQQGNVFGPITKKKPSVCKKALKRDSATKKMKGQENSLDLCKKKHKKMCKMCDADDNEKGGDDSNGMESHLTGVPRNKETVANQQKSGSQKMKVTLRDRRLLKKRKFWDEAYHGDEAAYGEVDSKSFKLTSKKSSSAEAAYGEVDSKSFKLTSKKSSSAEAAYGEVDSKSFKLTSKKSSSAEAAYGEVDSKSFKLTSKKSSSAEAAYGEVDSKSFKLTSKKSSSAEAAYGEVDSKSFKLTSKKSSSAEAAYGEVDSKSFKLTSKKSSSAEAAYGEVDSKSFKLTSKKSSSDEAAYGEVDSKSFKLTSKKSSSAEAAYGEVDSKSFKLTSKKSSSDEAAYGEVDSKSFKLTSKKSSNDEKCDAVTDNDKYFILSKNLWSCFCNFCKIRFMNRRNLVQHLAITHLRPYTVHRGELQSGFSFQCNYCKEIFQTWFHYINHIPEHSSTVIQKFCWWCASKSANEYTGISQKYRRALQKRKNFPQTTSARVITRAQQKNRLSVTQNSHKDNKKSLKKSKQVKSVLVVGISKSAGKQPSNGRQEDQRKQLVKTEPPDDGACLVLPNTCASDAENLQVNICQLSNDVPEPASQSTAGKARTENKIQVEDICNLREMELEVNLLDIRRFENMSDMVNENTLSNKGKFAQKLSEEKPLGCAVELEEKPSDFLKGSEENASNSVKNENVSNSVKKNENASNSVKNENASNSVKKNENASNSVKKNENASNSVKKNENASNSVKNENVSNSVKKNENASNSVKNENASNSVKKNENASNSVKKNENASNSVKKNENASNSVKNENASNSVKNENASNSVKNENASNSVKNENASNSVKNENASNSVKNENASNSVKNENASISVKNENASISVKNENASISVKNENASISVKNENASISVKNENASISVKNENASISVKNENASISVKNENASISVKNENASISVKNEDASISVKNENASNSVKKNENASISVNNENASISVKNENASISVKNENASNSVKKNENASNSVKKNENASNSVKKNENASNSVKKNENASNSVKKNENASNSVKKNENASNSVKKNENASNSVKKNENASNSVKKNENASNSVKKNENASISVKKNENASISVKNENASNSVKKNENASSCTKEKIVSAGEFKDVLDCTKESEKDELGCTKESKEDLLQCTEQSEETALECTEESKKMVSSRTKESEENVPVCIKKFGEKESESTEASEKNASDCAMESKEQTPDSKNTFEENVVPKESSKKPVLVSKKKHIENTADRKKKEQNDKNELRKNVKVSRKESGENRAVIKRKLKKKMSNIKKELETKVPYINKAEGGNIAASRSGLKKNLSNRLLSKKYDDDDPLNVTVNLQKRGRGRPRKYPIGTFPIPRKYKKKIKKVPQLFDGNGCQFVPIAHRLRRNSLQMACTSKDANRLHCCSHSIKSGVNFTVKSENATCENGHCCEKTECGLDKTIIHTVHPGNRVGKITIRCIKQDPKRVQRGGNAHCVRNSNSSESWSVVSGKRKQQTLTSKDKVSSCKQVASRSRNSGKESHTKTKAAVQMLTKTGKKPQGNDGQPRRSLRRRKFTAVIASSERKLRSSRSDSKAAEAEKGKSAQPQVSIDLPTKDSARECISSEESLVSSAPARGRANIQDGNSSEFEAPLPCCSIDADCCKECADAFNKEPLMENRALKELRQRVKLGPFKWELDESEVSEADTIQNSFVHFSQLNAERTLKSSLEESMSVKASISVPSSVKKYRAGDILTVSAMDSGSTVSYSGMSQHDRYYYPRVQVVRVDEKGNMVEVKDDYVVSGRSTHVGDSEKIHGNGLMEDDKSSSHRWKMERRMKSDGYPFTFKKTRIQ